MFVHDILYHVVVFSRSNSVAGSSRAKLNIGIFEDSAQCFRDNMLKL